MGSISKSKLNMLWIFLPWSRIVGFHFCERQKHVLEFVTWTSLWRTKEKGFDWLID